MKSNTPASASLLVCAILASSGNAFVPALRTNSMAFKRPLIDRRTKPLPSQLYSTAEERFDVTSLQVSNAQAEQQQETFATKESKLLNKAPPKKGNAAYKQGILSPAVLGAKMLLGEENLNKVRAKAISLHSDVIGSFVMTADTEFGKAVLKQMFTLLDKNQDSTIDENELSEAFQKLGFTWLKEKQVRGIIERADKDANNVLDIEEFIQEAPKTLKTNLIKLAKKNGGDLGLLV